MVVILKFPHLKANCVLHMTKHFKIKYDWLYLKYMYGMFIAQFKLFKFIIEKTTIYPMHF